MEVHKFAWSSIRRLGNSRAAKLTILAPFIPFIFSLFDTVVEIPGLTEYLRQFRINWPQPDLTALYWFYYGLMSLAIASLVYTLRCPDIVKQYPDATAFSEREARFIGPTQFQTMAAFVTIFVEGQSFSGSARYFHGDYWQKVVAGETTTTYYSNEDKDAVLDRNTKLCQEYYMLLDHHRPISRFVSLALYVIGFILIAIPTLMKFWDVSYRLLA